jgi:hypothetical protein
MSRRKESVIFSLSLSLSLSSNSRVSQSGYLSAHSFTTLFFHLPPLFPAPPLLLRYHLVSLTIYRLRSEEKKKEKESLYERIEKNGSAPQSGRL